MIRKCRKQCQIKIKYFIIITANRITINKRKNQVPYNLSLKQIIKQNPNISNDMRKLIGLKVI